jgi:hypothetical protein
MGREMAKATIKVSFFDIPRWIKNLTLNHQETMETTTRVATIMEREMVKGTMVTTAERADMAGKLCVRLAPVALIPLSSWNIILY